MSDKVLFTRIFTFENGYTMTVKFLEYAKCACGQWFFSQEIADEHKSCLAKKP